jgi:hypothetical protein
VLGGLGLASITVGTVVALRAFSKRDSISEMCPPGSVCAASTRDELDALRTQADVANFFVWGGIASLTGGAITYFTAPSPERADRSTASLRVTPSVAPGSAAIWATGRF